MQNFGLVLLAAVVLPGSAVSPIGKVVQMLSDLQAKIIREGEEAQKVYDEFSEWCEDRSKNVDFEIKTGKANVEELTASIASETAKIGSLGSRVEELSGSLAADEADLKAATGVREKERADFVAQEKELTEISDMLERAMGVLEREARKTGGAALLQKSGAQGKVLAAMAALVQASGFSTADASKLTALVQSAQEGEDSDLGAPDAAAYEGHSGDIIDTLQSLLEKAQTQLADARKKETAAQHNFDMLKQSLTDSIKFGNKDMDEAKKGIAGSTERRATAQGDLEVTSNDLKEDTAVLRDLHHNCMTKSQDFEAEVKGRDEELAALAQAKKIIQETTGGAAQQSYSLLQASQSRLASEADLVNFEVVRFVRDLSHKQDSPALAQLASKIASAVRLGDGNNEDVFRKVKALISDMVARLEEEGAADASQKAYCDKETGETTAKKADKTAESEKLSTQIDRMNSRSAKLKDEAATLQQELAELAKSQSRMDKVRGEEKALFAKNKEEMSNGLEGVKLALKVLRDYYAKEADGAASGAGGSIVGLLEVVESDFSKGLAGLVATEQASQVEYDAQTKENELEKATKDQDVKYKTKESTSLDKAVSDANSDLSGVQAELDAINEYMGKLDASCVEVAETYSERAARREAEISGLREALEILGGGAALLQRASALRR